MRIAIIGPRLGGDLGRLLARAGHEVVFTGSRDVRKLARAAELAGPNARTDTVANAIDDAGVVVMTVPFERSGDIARAAGPALRDKVVVDTSNPIVTRDGRAEFLAIPAGLTAAQHQQRTLGPVRLVKAFNQLCICCQVAELSQRTGDQRIAVPFVGDDPDAKLTVARLIADANFVPVDAGTLADAAAIEPTSVDAWPPPRTEPEARAYLDSAKSLRGPAS